MTRKEQRLKAARDFASCNPPCRTYDAFIEGAKWADQTMIDKACEWLRDLDVFTEDFINDFRKEMKGD